MSDIPVIILSWPVLPVRLIPGELFTEGELGPPPFRDGVPGPELYCEPPPLSGVRLEPFRPIRGREGPERREDDMDFDKGGPRDELEAKPFRRAGGRRRDLFGVAGSLATLQS
jgi:hypothetical protein